MKKNGQALVEFIIILPVIIMLLLSIIDFGLVFYNKNSLEGNLEEVVSIYKETKDENSIKEYLSKSQKNITYTLEKSDSYTTIKLEENYTFLTPGLNIVFKNPYKIKVARVIYDE